MEEIRRKKEELTREELEAQKIELLPDREEMQAVSANVNAGAVGGNLAQQSSAQD
jgi:hypothetical protein